MTDETILIALDGTRWERVRRGNSRVNAFCFYCGVVAGELHQHGCISEFCPRCVTSSDDGDPQYTYLRLCHRCDYDQLPRYSPSEARAVAALLVAAADGE